MTKKQRQYFIFGITLIIIFIVLLLFKPNKSEYSGQLVIDDANLLSKTQKEFVNKYHDKLLTTYDIDYYVLTTKNTEDIDTFANKQFRAHNVGKHSKSGRGLLLVINPDQDLVRIEVSAALEGVYTDSFISYIQQRQMVYFFRTNRVADGILATTELIFNLAHDAQKNQAFYKTNKNFSTGAGAKTNAKLGKGANNSYSSTDTQNITPVKKNLSPAETVKAYFTAMDRRDGRADLQIYSKDTIQMLHQWTITPAQMDNVAKEYAKCQVDKINISGNYAVVRYNIEERQCSPYFLIKEDGMWKLDLTMMQKAIRFNHNNLWHFDLNNPALKPYNFAFSDWNFDQNGFPYQ